MTSHVSLPGDLGAGSTRDSVPLLFTLESLAQKDAAARSRAKEPPVARARAAAPPARAANVVRPTSEAPRADAVPKSRSTSLVVSGVLRLIPLGLGAWLGCYAGAPGRGEIATRTLELLASPSLFAADATAEPIDRSDALPPAVVVPVSTDNMIARPRNDPARSRAALASRSASRSAR